MGAMKPRSFKALNLVEVTWERKKWFFMQFSVHRVETWFAGSSHAMEISLVFPYRKDNVYNMVNNTLKSISPENTAYIEAAFFLNYIFISLRALWQSIKYRSIQWKQFCKGKYDAVQVFSSCNLGIYICVCVCVCVYTHIQMHIYVYIHTPIYMYVYMCY